MCPSTPLPGVLFALSVIDRNSVMAGVLGGATALAGLLVVFQGSLTTTYTSLAGASQSVKAPYRRAINGALATIVLTLLVGILALATVLVTAYIQALLFSFTAGAFLSMLVLLAARA